MLDGLGAKGNNACMSCYCDKNVRNSEGELLGCRTLANEKMVNRVGGHECGVTLWQV
jgi:hypothetical protein